MKRFTLKKHNWYALELISAEFGPEARHYSPIRVDNIEPKKSGSRLVELSFLHAAYPEGVQNKSYTLQTIERSEAFLLSRVDDGTRIALLTELTDAWLQKHFDESSLRFFEHLKQSSPASISDPTSLYTACLLGGAVGDALGGAVEFMSRAAIVQRFGPQGITDYAEAYGGKGKITDDTQMTLFTAEGMLRGQMRGVHKGITSYDNTVANAYCRWLATQGIDSPGVSVDTDGWLFQQRELHSQRAPGTTCLNALKHYSGNPKTATNNSKGCGGVMRVAPVGLFWFTFKPDDGSQRVFKDGCMCAAITHGHPSGYLAAGVLAVIIYELLNGLSLIEAIAVAKQLLIAERDHQEVLAALNNAVALSQSNTPSEQAISELGEGWVAEEALAISVYCALVGNDFEQGVQLAVNHDGDSDSTGAITGNILGIIYGLDSIPARWLEPLELKSVIETVAADLWSSKQWYSYMDDEQAWQRYPGY